MAIVASNSLTISNVNDGTITHIAYANIVFLCKENGNFTLSATSIVRYGSDSRWFYKELQAGTYTATNTLFGGDPASGTQKNVELVDKFSTSNSINSTHIGMYADNVNLNSTDPSKYLWTLVKGIDGKTPYLHTAYSWSADGKDRFTTVYPNLNLLTNTSSETRTMIVGNNQTAATFGGVSVYNFSNMTVALSIYLDLTNVQYDVRIQLWSSKGMIVGNFIPAGQKGYSVALGTVPTITSSDASNIALVTRTSVTSDTTITYSKLKLEQGSTATPYMPSYSEVTTADWPSYIGQYSDFTSTASTDPTKYAPWTVFKGNDGPQGPTGPAGSNGDPGKIVYDTEPTTRFKGLTWKYSGTSDLTASDGTVIHPNTEYYYNGTHWMINYLSANNLEANSITADLIDAKNLTITDGEFVSTITDGPVQIQTEIKDDHLLIYKMDTSHNDITTIALKSDSGLGMTYQNSDTSQYTSSGINLQGIFTQDNILKNGVSLTPGGVKFTQNGASAGLNFDGTNLSSSMPIQAPNTIVKSTQFTVSGIGIRLDRMMSFVAVTFSGQASSTITNTPTINNVLPVGFRPISPYSIDYMIPLNTANNGYIYFNPDGSIRIMATINSGYYIRGTRLYITNDVYPS